MEIRQMYKYTGSNGETVTNIVLPMEKTSIKRLVASSGKSLTKDGINLCSVVDVEDVEGWYEVDSPEEDVI